MIAESKIKPKSKTISGRIKNLVLDFILYFITAYIMRKYAVQVTWALGKTPNTLCITWGSKKKKTNFYDKQFTIVTTHKNVQNYHNEKCTYNVNTHCNLLYALKIWNCNFIQKKSLTFFA